MEFNVCSQGHRLPEWWHGPCLTCDYPGGLEILREKVKQGEMYGTPAASANTTPMQTDDVCSCGKPKRPRGSDCWTCYRSSRKE